jgi:ApaG protein
MNDSNTPYQVSVQVQSAFVPEQSRPDDSQYVFAYTVTIRNDGQVPAQLLTRHWIITDGHGEVQEVKGDGVVGEQPRLTPGEAFRYTSGAVIETPVGSMRGSYQMRADDGTEFDALIEAFTLAVPHVRH